MKTRYDLFIFIYWSIWFIGNLILPFLSIASMYINFTMFLIFLLVMLLNINMRFRKWFNDDIPNINQIRIKIADRLKTNP